MKFFHWNKQCITTIQELTNQLKEEKVKHEVALQGISINERVCNELQKKAAHLEHELNELSSAYSFLLEQNKKLQEELSSKKSKQKDKEQTITVVNKPIHAI